jgi:uncharacterized lipoprotein YbaY
LKQPLILAAALLAPACAGSAPKPAAVPPLVDAAAASFICDDGQAVKTERDPALGVMRVTRGSDVLLLQEQVGVQPPRYVTGSDTLVFAENRVLLQRGKELRAACDAIPVAPTNGLLWGTLTKLDRMALVPGTRAKVLLVDAARADAPAVEIASTSLTTRGNQVPLHFRIAYPPERVSPRPMTYRLQARIESPDGQLMYITDTATFVLEAPAPQPPVELGLVRTSGQ